MRFKNLFTVKKKIFSVKTKNESLNRKKNRINNKLRKIIIIILERSCDESKQKPPVISYCGSDIKYYT